MGGQGSSSNIISLPQGGGALQGLGEKFSPDPYTGTGNFTVPISVPPGRNGFQPGLSLDYSTGQGNGPFGLGWDLTIPRVSRKTSKGVPRYRDNSVDSADADTFVLSGSEDLVPLSAPATSPATYRPRTEGLFGDIQHHSDAVGDYWEVRTKDGLTSYYGTPGGLGADPAVIVDPGGAGQSRVFAWMLSATVDPFGNRIEYEYERETGSVGGQRRRPALPRQIRYVDYNDGDGQGRFLVSVTFEYEVGRPDSFCEYRAGFAIRTTRRCSSIAMAHRCRRGPARPYLQPGLSRSASRTRRGCAAQRGVVAVPGDLYRPRWGEHGVDAAAGVRLHVVPAWRSCSSLP